VTGTFVQFLKVNQPQATISSSPVVVDSEGAWAITFKSGTSFMPGVDGSSQRLVFDNATAWGSLSGEPPLQAIGASQQAEDSFVLSSALNANSRPNEVLLSSIAAPPTSSQATVPSSSAGTDSLPGAPGAAPSVVPLEAGMTDAYARPEALQNHQRTGTEKLRRRSIAWVVPVTVVGCLALVCSLIMYTLWLRHHQRESAIGVDGRLSEHHPSPSAKPPSSGAAYRHRLQKTASESSRGRGSKWRLPGHRSKRTRRFDSVSITLNGMYSGQGDEALLSPQTVPHTTPYTASGGGQVRTAAHDLLLSRTTHSEVIASAQV
jgi:hypothetical protein